VLPKTVISACHGEDNKTDLTSPLESVISAVGPIDATAVEIKQVAMKKGEKDMVKETGWILILENTQDLRGFYAWVNSVRSREIFD